MGPSYLNVSDDEMKMADNFYTVLSNNMQEVWFHQGIELGGGEAFTVSQQGVEHNRRYIVSIWMCLGYAIRLSIMTDEGRGIS